MAAIESANTRDGQRERQERELTERLVLALEAGGLGTWRWDMETGQTEWDERLEALFGLPPGGFDGTFDAYVTLLHPEDREEVLASVAHAIENSCSYRVEHRVIWPDGSIHWLSGAGLATCDDGGEATGTIACVLDVTDRAEAVLAAERSAELAGVAADREKHLRERLELLNQINEVLGAANDTRGVMVDAVQNLVPELADWCVIHVVPEEGGSPEVEFAHRYPAMADETWELWAKIAYRPDGSGGVGAVIRTGLPEYVPELTDEVLTVEGVSADVVDAVRALDLHSAMTIPLNKRGRTLGAIEFLSGPARTYDSEDLILATAVADRVAVSLVNRRLAEQQRLIATTLQNSLLPAALPDIEGLSMAVRYWAAGEGTKVGGDFYDVFRVDDKRWVAVIGDVCGTGPSAAALTGLARHSIRMSAWNGNGPAECMSQLNRSIRETRRDSFLTTLLVEIDTTDDGYRLTLASGGHPRPVLVRADGSHEVLPTAGTLLGVFDEISCIPLAATLEPGDMLVLYTDGITDLPDPHSIEPSALAEMIGRAGSRSTAEAVADQVRVGIEEVLPLGERDDDIALLVILADERTTP